MNSVLPQLLLVIGATAWGLGWLPLHHFANVGLVGMPLVLLVYGSLSVVAAVLSSAWLGAQSISPNEWLGAALVTFAALIASWPERPVLTAIRSSSI